jgi:hypothetical protein
MVTIKKIGTGETIGSSEQNKTQPLAGKTGLNNQPAQSSEPGVTIRRISTGEVLGTTQRKEPEGLSLPTLEPATPARRTGGFGDTLKRIGQGILSGVTRRAANTSEKLGTVMDLHGGTAMRGVYEDQVQMLDQEIAALERLLRDPTMTPQEILEAQEALTQRKQQRDIYTNAIRSNENTGKGIHETVDQGLKYAQEQAEKSVEGTSGVGRAALSFVPTATEIALDVGLNKLLPLGANKRFGLGYLARAASEGGASEAEYRNKAGENYDPQAAAQRGMIASAGVAAGSLASAAVNKGVLGLLKNKGLQNYVIPNVLKGGLNATAFAGGDVAMRELARASTEDEYTPDWKQVGGELATAFAFGVVTEFISTAAITGQNKAYMRQLNQNLEKGYEYTKSIMQDPRATVEQRAAGANSVMQMADELDNALNNMQVVGAQKEVNAIRDFLASVRAEMTGYLADAAPQSAGNIGGMTGGLATVAPPTTPANVQQPTQPTAPVQQAPSPAASPANVAGMAATTPTAAPAQPAQQPAAPQAVQPQASMAPAAKRNTAPAQQEGLSLPSLEEVAEQQGRTPYGIKYDQAGEAAIRMVAEDITAGKSADQLMQAAAEAHKSYQALQASIPYGVPYTEDQMVTLHLLDLAESFYESAAQNPQRTLEQITEVLKSPSPALPANNQIGGMNNEQSAGAEPAVAGPAANELLDGGQKRDVDLRAGGQTGRVAEGAEQRPAVAGIEQVQTANQRQDLARHLRGEKVSSRSLGLSAGTDTANLTVVPAESWDEQMRETAQRVERDTGKSVTYVLGRIQIKDANGNIRRVRGVYSPAGIIIQADNLGVNINQIADHEIYHDLSENDPGLDAKVEERIREQFTPEQFDKILDKYIDKLNGIISLSEDATPDELEAAIKEIKNEIFADAYAGINAFGAHAETLGGAVNDVTNERLGMRGGEYAAATDRTTGPPERYSYGGRNANRADLDALAEAERLEMQGVDDETIRQMTGWHRGMEGKWRFEIDDSGMKYRRGGDAYFRSAHPEYAEYQGLMERMLGGELLPEADEARLQELDDTWGREYGRLSERVDRGNATLADIVEHPELFRNYPQLRFTRVRFEDLPRGVRGQYYADGNEITLDNSLRGAPEDTLVHEVQHAIQNAEGFTNGSSVDSWRSTLAADQRRSIEEADAKVRRIFASMPEDVKNKVRAINRANADQDWDTAIQLENELYDEGYGDLFAAYEDAHFDRLAANEKQKNADLDAEAVDKYLNTAGEIEARDVTARRGMTPEERRATAPARADERTVYADDENGLSLPSLEPKTRFSLDEPVEETETLVAQHNLDDDKLRRMMELGAIPSPSIAIVRADQGHAMYGPYSIVFPRETVDPQADSRNKVYGSDAWTPTHSNARVEREVNYDVLQAIDDRIDELSSQVAGGTFHTSSALGSLGFDDATEMTEEQIAERLANRDEVRAAYLAAQGETLEPIKRAKEWNKYGNDFLRLFLDEVDPQRLAQINADLMEGADVREALGAEYDTIRGLLREYYANMNEGYLQKMAQRKGWTPEETDKQREIRIDKSMENVTDFTVEDFAKDAWAFYEDGGKTKGEIDRAATSDALRERVDDKEVEAWVKEQLDGLLGKSGIWNGKDPYNARGDRKSFAQLHWPVTAENIVRAMNLAKDRGSGYWGVGASGLHAVATTDFKTVGQMHEEEHRLHQESEEDYAARFAELDEELKNAVQEVMRTTKHHADSSFEEYEIVGDVIMQAAQGEHTAEAVRRAFQKEGYDIKPETAQMVADMCKRAAEIPTGYFEAKPKRVVGFDEALALVAPDNAPADIKKWAEENFRQVLTYEEGNEDQRRELVNNIPKARFSVDDMDELSLPELEEEKHEAPAPYSGAAILQESTIDKYLKDYAAPGTPNYAQAYIAWMDPQDFINLTTSRGGREIIEQTKKPLNADEFAKATQQNPLQLNIDHETGEITGHEGRHRAAALRDAGVEKIPVLLFDSGNKYDKAPIDILKLHGQDFGSSKSYADLYVHDLLPLSYENRGEIIKRFGTQRAIDRFNEKYNGTQSLRYSTDDTTETPAKQTKAEKPAKREKKKPPQESLPIIAKRELRQDMLNLFSIPAGQRAELGEIIDQYADRILRQGNLGQRDMDAFFDRMYAEGVMSVAAEDYYQDARRAITGRRIYVNDIIKGDFGDEWNDFRKRAFAAGLYLVNDRTAPGVDVVNAELSSLMPGTFDEDTYDMKGVLERAVQLAEEGKDQKMSLAEYTAMLAEQEYVSEDEILSNIERQMDWLLRTFAQKAQLELTLRDRTGVKLAQASDKSKQRVENEKAREAQRRAKDRERRREMEQRQRDRRELQELQQKTLKQLQWLSKNRYRAPEQLRAAWDEVLGDIDIYAVSAANEMNWSNKYGATWRDLADMYKDAQKNDPNFLPSKELERIVTRLDADKIEDMDPAALADLYKAAVGLRTEFYNRNNVINDEQHRLFSEVYTDAKGEIGRAASGYTGKKLDKFLNMEQLTPMNFLERMGGWDTDGAWYSMARQLEQGEREMRDYRVKAERQLEDFLREHEEWVKKADGQGKDAIWYELEVPQLLELGMGDKPIFGPTVKVYMTPAQKVHLYLESKSYDNLRHMVGGRTFADKKLYSEGKRQEAFAQGRTVKLAPETVKKIVSNLTPEEQELAKVLEDYYNNFAAKKINEKSNILYGYDKAMSKNYAPIYTNRNYVNSEIGVFDTTAEGVGNLKARQYSKNPSYNIGAFDAFERHIDQTARFVGMAIPARNWQTLLNYREQNNSMGDVITHKWGEEAKRYITDLLTTLQGGGRAGKKTLEGAADKLLSNYVTAVFGANPGIVFKQAASFPQFAAALGWENAPSVGQMLHVDENIINAYTSELAYRQLGYATPETAQLKNNPNFLDSNKATRFLLRGGAITAMDAGTVKRAWPWAENKVRREYPELEVGTEEQIRNGESPFYRKVAEEFENAVSMTQPMYDEMHRPEIMKNGSGIQRAFTMFKTVPLQQYNSLRRSFGELQAAKQKVERANDTQKPEAEEQEKAAAKKAGAAVTATLASVLMLEAVEMLNQLAKNRGKNYRNDEGELTAGSVGERLARNATGDLAGMVIGGDELTDILANWFLGEKWYGIEIPGGEQLNDIIDAAGGAAGTIQKIITEGANILANGGDLGEYFRRNAGDYAGAAKELAEKLAMYLGGLPVQNVEKYILGAMQTISPELYAGMEDIFDTPTKNDLKGLSGDALATRADHILKARGVEISDETAAALAELYEAGQKTSIPPDTPSSITVNGEDRKLNAYQRQTYDLVWSANVERALDDLTSSSIYRQATLEEQAKMIDKVYDYAAEKAKGVLFDDYETKSSTAKADDMLGAGSSIAEWAAWSVSAKDEDRATQYEQVLASDMSENAKLAAIGNLIGTDMETDARNPTQWAKLNTAVKDGYSVEEAIGLMQSDNLDDYMKWRESDAKAAGVKAGTYIEFRNTLSGTTADKDASGKTISGSKKKKVLAYINSLDLTAAQKDALYYDAGYTQSTIGDAPWHGGELQGLSLPTLGSQQQEPQGELQGLSLPKLGG